MTSKTSRHAFQKLADAEREYAVARDAHAAARETFEAASLASDVAVCAYGHNAPENQRALHAFFAATRALRIASDDHALARTRLDRCQATAGVV